MMDEWGPWIEHDGNGCPCLGKVVETITRDGERNITVAGAACAREGNDPDGPCSAWVWHYGPAIFGDGELAWVDAGGHIVRYRVRKPRGLTMLEEIAQGIKQPEDA